MWPAIDDDDDVDDCGDQRPEDNRKRLAKERELALDALVVGETGTTYLEEHHHRVDRRQNERHETDYHNYLLIESFY